MLIFLTKKGVISSAEVVDMEVVAIQEDITTAAL